MESLEEVENKLKLAKTLDDFDNAEKAKTIVLIDIKLIVDQNLTAVLDKTYLIKIHLQYYILQKQILI